MHTHLISSNDAFSSHYSTAFWGLAALHSFAACTVSHLLWHPDISTSVLSSCRGSLLPDCAGTGLEDPEPARASGQRLWSAQPPPCSESAVTLPAEKSFPVGRFSFPVPLLAIFCLPFSCHSLLLPAWPAACLPACQHFVFPSANKHVAPWPATIPVCPRCLAFQLTVLVGLPLAPQPPCEAHRTSRWLPGPAARLALLPSRCFSASLRRYCIKREEVFGFFSRRLFKVSCYIIKKCFHQAISSLPSCEYLSFTLRLGARPGFGLCARPFALFRRSCFQWKRLKMCSSSEESCGKAPGTAALQRAASIPSPHVGQTKAGKAGLALALSGCTCHVSENAMWMCNLTLLLARQNSQCCSRPSARRGFISKNNKSMGQYYLMGNEKKNSPDFPEKKTSCHL